MSDPISLLQLTRVIALGNRRSSETQSFNWIMKSLDIWAVWQEVGELRSK
ncbi:hypothetical protein N6L24_14150 [Cognatishimia sp. SS12]|nr:hypothetical protein [Cognatishimia sp. SS12]MDC0739426.1 hypothetical protein [Cognatishimia sp. SS12]